MRSPTDTQIRRVQTWTEYLARILVMATVFVSVVGIIFYSIDLYRNGTQKHYIGWFSSAGFVLLTIPISVRLIVNHLTHYNAPNIQKYVVRIVWMIPIYSIESWLALRFTSAAIYIETIRECYEAYVIFCFFYFLITVLGDEQQLILKLKQKPAEFGRHSWPISMFISPWAMGNEIYQKCKFGVFQYVLIKNIIAILVCVLASKGQYFEGRFRFDEFYLYQCLINNASQLWALYCLVLFYFATKEELAPWRPVGKFLCVKTVVFFTWWQGIIFDILAPPLNRIGTAEQEDRQWTNYEVSKGLQNYVICIEMFVASIAFTYAFTHKDYQTSSKAKSQEDAAKPFLSALLQSSVPDDIISDLKRYVRHNGVVKKVLATIGVKDSGSDGHMRDSDSDEEAAGLVSTDLGGASAHGVGSLHGGSDSGSGPCLIPQANPSPPASNTGAKVVGVAVGAVSAVASSSTGVSSISRSGSTLAGTANPVLSGSIELAEIGGPLRNGLSLKGTRAGSSKSIVATPRAGTNSAGASSKANVPKVEGVGSAEP